MQSSEPQAPFTARTRVLLVTLFVSYLVLLTWIVLWKLTVPSIGAAAFLPHPIKWVPFIASGDAGASNPLEVAANVVLFIPFGVYLRLLGSSWRTWRLVAVFTCSSLLFEITQHVLSIGSFDITDVISNTAGGVAGLGLLVLARRTFRTGFATIMIRILVIGSLLGLVAVGLYLASPVRYVDRQDVVVPLPGTR